MQISYQIGETTKKDKPKAVVLIVDGCTIPDLSKFEHIMAQEEIQVIVKGLENLEELKKDKVTSALHRSFTKDMPAFLSIVNVPISDDAPTRKSITEINKEISASIKELLSRADQVLVVNTSSATDEGGPSYVRLLNDAVYDYKDIDRNDAAKIVKIHGCELYPVSATVHQDISIHESMVFTRNLVTMPPNDATPQYLVEQAKLLVGGKIKMVKHDPVKEGMGGLIGVGRGSSLAPEFIELVYTGKPATDKTVDYVFIGKGITYDSGGYSLKPPKSMETMKGDMAGAASVLGLFHYLTENFPALNIVGLIPSCENMIGKDAIVPGEVITYANGKTVEVLNTDAEGRLILADALIYSHKFAGAAVIDIATLTGGIVAGLGKFRTGLFTDSAELKKEIEDSAFANFDPVWHMPMDDEVYKPKSKVADMPNIVGGPSSITAAMFLRAFAPEKWAHLDVAGTAGDDVGTGRPVPLLVGLVTQ